MASRVQRRPAKRDPKFERARLEYFAMNDRERETLACLVLGNQRVWYSGRVVDQKCIAALAEEEEEIAN